jgi:hypothetical protein
MNIEVYDAIPNIMLERLVSFENDYNGKNWNILYKAMIELNSKYPDVVIASTPYLYSDLEKKTSGFLIIDQKTEKLYYIH